MTYNCFRRCMLTFFTYYSVGIHPRLDSRIGRGVPNVPSGCEARAINLCNKNVKIGTFTGGTSVRSKNIFTDISWYHTGKHEIKLYYYIPVIFLAQIQASHASEIQHDEKKNPYLHTVKYGSKYGMMTYRTSELLSKFYFYTT